MIFMAHFLFDSWVLWVIITITHCNMFKISYALFISVCHLSNQMCLFLKMTKKIATIPPLIQSWKLSRRLNGGFMSIPHKCTFLIDSHLHWTHCYQDLYVDVTYTPGYSLLFLVLYTPTWAYSNLYDNQSPHHKIYIIMLYTKMSIKEK